MTAKNSPSHTSTLRRGSARGFTLVELLVAMVVMTAGLLAGIAFLSVAAASNSRSKFDTTAATVAESVMERIVSIPQKSTGAAAQSAITDCAGTTFTIDTVPGGASLTASGNNIDFTQALPAGNYSAQYKVCSSTGNLAYDVRWRVDPGPTTATQMVTVGAKVAGGSQNQPTMFAFPGELRTLRGGWCKRKNTFSPDPKRAAPPPGSH